MNNVKISDRINTDTLLDNVKMLSVNRINAQIKLTEGWKTLNSDDNNLNITLPQVDPNERSSRSILMTTFISDAARL